MSETTKRTAEKANRLVNDPAFIEALADIRKDLYDQIVRSEHNEQSLREDCYNMLRSIDKFESKLKRYINRGKS